MRLPVPSRLRLSVVAPLAAGLAALGAGLLAYAMTGSAAIAVALGAAAAASAGAFFLGPLSTLAAQSGMTPLATTGDKTSSFAETAAFERALSNGRFAFESLGRVSRERDHLQAALDGSADAVVGVDAGGNVCYMNTAAERLLGSKRDDAAGRPFAWVVPNVDVIEALEESRERGFRVVRSVEMPNRQLLRATTERLSEGGPWSAMAVLHDVTEVRRAEQMRRDFVANVSHELRTPLASIKAVLETLEAGAISDPAAARDFLSRAETEVDRLTNMLTDLLELSRIESGAGGEPEPVDIGGAATDAVERLRSQAIRGEIVLTCEVEGGLPLVAGDSERIERALINLIENAIKFTPPGGHIDVHASRREDWVAIEVSDDGAGIDDRDLPRIFERFYKADNSRRTVGSGLGLALVKHTAEAYGGLVRVESELGRGSKFTILLPAAGRIAPEVASEARRVP